MAEKLTVFTRRDLLKGAGLAGAAAAAPLGVLASADAGAADAAPEAAQRAATANAAGGPALETLEALTAAEADTLEAIWHYPGDTLVTFSQYNATGAAAAARPCEIEFRGTKGTLYFRLGGYEVVPEVILPNEFPARTPRDRSVERGYRKGGKPAIKPRKVDGRIQDADARHSAEPVGGR